MLFGIFFCRGARCCAFCVFICVREMKRHIVVFEAEVGGGGVWLRLWRRRRRRRLLLLLLLLELELLLLLDGCAAGVSWTTQTADAAAALFPLNLRAVVVIAAQRDHLAILLQQ